MKTTSPRVKAILLGTGILGVSAAVGAVAITPIANTITQQSAPELKKSFAERLNAVRPSENAQGAQEAINAHRPIVVAQFRNVD